MDKKDLFNLLNSKDIRCITNSKDVIFVDSIEPYINIDDKNYCDGINVILNGESVQDDISQLYCILDCGCHKNLEDFYSENHGFDDLDKFYEAAKKIAPKPVELTYCWYHHMMDNKDREAIQKALDEHDFDTFIKYYKIYNSKGIKEGFIERDEFNAFFPITYLPDTAIYFVDNVAYWLNILTIDNFNRIFHSESECG